MVKAIVSGAAGRMGGRIIHMIEAAEDIELAGALERPDHPAVGKDVGEVVGLPARGIPVAGSLAEVLPKGEVLLEFTHPGPSLAHLKEALAMGKAMVIGTTGFSPEQMAEIRELAPRGRVVLAPNMSVGVNLMFKVVEDVARVLTDGYDVEIVEAHHRLKKDAPSGTALKLAQVIAQALAGTWRRWGSMPARGSSANAAKRRSASKRSGPGTSSGSTR